MKQVKGSMFRDVVRAIKAMNKEGHFDNLLSEETKNYLSQRILSSSWYPLEAYKDGLNALFKVVAKNNENVVVKWGRDFCDVTMKSIYKQIIADGDIKRAMERYKRFHNMIFNFGEFTYDFISDNEIMLYYKDHESDFKVYFYLIKGWNERFLELCTNKKVKSMFLKKTWTGDELTTLKISW